MASKPTQRTIATLKRQGFISGIVEKFNHFVKIRQDYCGFGDIIAFHPDQDITLIIQACADCDVSKRVLKIMAEPRAKVWVSQPSRKCEVWGWGKKGGRGERKLWTLRKVEITPAMFKTLTVEKIEIPNVGRATFVST